VNQLALELPWSFNYTYESMFYEARVSFEEGRQIKEAENHNVEFKKILLEKMRTSKYFATDGSKMENKPFVGFVSIDINDSRSRKFRIAKIASTFTAEALAIGETLEILADWLGLDSMWMAPTPFMLSFHEVHKLNA
jgi:hypothetical protein